MERKVLKVVVVVRQGFLSTERLTFSSQKLSRRFENCSDFICYILKKRLFIAFDTCKEVRTQNFIKNIRRPRAKYFSDRHP